MAKRRRLRGFLSGLGEGIGNASQLMMRSQLQKQNTADAREAMTVQAALTNLMSRSQDIAKRVQAGDLTPEQADAEYGSILQTPGMPEEMRTGARPNYGTMAPSPVKRLSPVVDAYKDKPTDIPEDTTTFATSQARLRGVAPFQTESDISNPAPGGLGLRPEVENVASLLDSMRTEGRKGVARKSVKYINPQGTQAEEFLTDEELGQRGAFQTERTTAQELARKLGIEPEVAGATATAQETAKMAPDLVNARVNEAGRRAGAEKRAQLQAEMARLGLTSQQQAAALQLADDYSQQSKNFIAQEDAFRTIVTLSRQASPAGDIGLIFAYMKMVDPASTVREGEQATARNAVGVPDWIRNLYNRAQTGESLSPSQRTDFVRTAKAQYEAAAENHKALDATFATRAAGHGVPLNLITRAANAPDTSDLNLPGTPQKRPAFTVRPPYTVRGGPGPVGGQR